MTKIYTLREIFSRAKVLTVTYHHLCDGGRMSRGSAYIVFENRKH